MKFDKIGDRLKKNYEDRTRILLPRRTYTIIRLDGKAFHTFTKKCERPFDYDLMSLMDDTAKELCASIQGTKFAYVQSDEISILLTDFETEKTDAWFDGNIQKMASISASMATAFFNKNLLLNFSEVLNKGDLSIKHKFGNKSGNANTAFFDSRVFTIADAVEVENYFIWRQMDATRNSIQMAAQSMYSHKELHGKNTGNMLDMIFAKGKNWDDYSPRCKRGGIILKKSKLVNNTERFYWDLDNETPIFHKDRDLLRYLIPKLETF